MAKDRRPIWADDPDLSQRDGSLKAAHAKEQRRFPLTRFRDIQVGQGRNYLVKGLIPRVGLVIVYGAPKCGKTFWVTDAVLHVALGREYRGHRVEQGAVVYIACEGERGLAGRLEAFRRRCLIEDDADPPFFLLPTRLDLVGEVGPLVSEIASQIGDKQPVAIVVDTLNRSLRGSESSDEDMGAYVQAADRLREEFECAVIIIHHCGIDDRRPRGHTSLAGAADAQLAVKREPNGDVVVRVEWMKDGAQGEEIISKLEVVEIGLDEDGEPMTSCVVVPSADERMARRAAIMLSPRLRRARDLLEGTIVRDGVVMSEPGDQSLVPKRVTCAKIDAWREECYRSLPVDSVSVSGSEAKRKAFLRVRQDLANRGIIKESGGWVWIVA